MKLGNVVLLCKGWYKMRDNKRLDLFWMDMAHAINADGWTMQSKKDVVAWCMHRLDNMRDDPKLANYKNQFKLSTLYDNVNNWIRRASWSNIELSQEDAIIWVYRDIVSNLDNSCFDECVKPDTRVLPVNLHEAWYDDGQYSKAPKLYPADMMCDFIEKVNEIMPDAKDQDIRDDDYDWVESFIKKESWKDVQIILGEDNLNDCIEVECTALNLKNHKVPGFDNHIELGKFENCKDLNNCEDPDKKYIVRLNPVVTKYDTPGWEDDVTYYLKSIREK